MPIPVPIEISHFFAIGINYKKTDADTRGQFAVSTAGYEELLRSAPQHHISSVFVLSTCNRTEIYGFAPAAINLIELLCTQTKGLKEVFEPLAYIKSGMQAVSHLFNVGAGLDSQILGDYEIIAQLKQAVKFSKERGFVDCFIERLFNSVLQSSKNIKNDTLLSGGTVSVSFAAIQYIKANVAIDASTRILLVGTGKIGRNTCKNLVDYLKTTNITLINRSASKAIELAVELNLKYAGLDRLEDEVKASDIILVASNADEPVILASHLKGGSKKLIIDLSIPYNVEAIAGEIPGVELVNIDMLSKLNDDTLKKREAELPKAKQLIAGHLTNFMEWYYMRKNAAALQAIKIKLNQLSVQHLLPSPHGPCLITQQKIQRIVNGTASKMRANNKLGCQYIEALNEFIQVAI